VPGPGLTGRASLSPLAPMAPTTAVHHRRPGKLLLLALALAASAWACGGGQAASPGASPSPTTPAPTPTPSLSPHAVIVSIDGLRPDALQQVETPNIQALAAAGAYTWKAQTILPSNTLPSHTSMLTGYPVSVHKITWDDYLPALGRITVPTVFRAARNAGLRSAMVAGKDKFYTFRDTGDMDVFIGGPRSDDDVANEAVVQLQTGVDLLFVHLPDVDVSGHKYGWMSATYMSKIRVADSAVGRIVAALPPNTSIVVTADHGGHGDNHGSAEITDTTIPWVIFGPRVRKGYALTSAVVTVDTSATAAYVLGFALSSDVAGRAVREAFVN
jgi:predicted AlkP superfamily pyrophosphatase or phosphodiesterase